MRARIALVLLGFAVGSCTCAGPGLPCANVGDCAADEICLVGADGSRTCQPAPPVGEGEGQGGEGEGEGQPPNVCGDGTVGGTEACDDGNANENDRCTSTCTATTVAVSNVLGAQLLRELTALAPRGVWASPDRGAVITDALGAIFYRPAASDRFFRVDDNQPISRARPVVQIPSQPLAAAVAPDERIFYYDDVPRVVRSLTPATGLLEDVFGDGSNNAPSDPPSWIFAGGALTVSVVNPQLDVDEAGTLYVASAHRVLALDRDGTTRVVEGCVECSQGGTPAQLLPVASHFVNDIALQADAGGAATDLWLSSVEASRVKALRVHLADGTVTTLDTQQPCPVASTCESVHFIAPDGVAGAYVATGPPEGGGDGVVHVDAQGVTPIAPPDKIAGVLDFAEVEPGVFFVPGAERVGQRLVHVDGTVEVVAPPAPAVATDRTLFTPFFLAAAASDAELFFASHTDLWAVDEAAHLRHIANNDDLGPCAVPRDVITRIGLPGFSGLAVTADGSQVYFSQGDPNRVCVLDVAAASTSVVIAGIPDPRRIALRDTDLLIESAGSDIESLTLASGADRGVAATSGTIGLAGAGSVGQYVEGNHRFSIGPPPSLTVTDLGALSFGTGVGVALDGASALVYSSAAHGIFRVDAANTATRLAGNGAGPGFRDGAAVLAEFEDGCFEVAKLASGAVLVACPTSIRLFDGASVRTVVGSDQLTDDGVFAQARLVEPATLACTGALCVAADVGPATLRALDFGAGRLTRVAGVDAAPLTGLRAAVPLSADLLLYTNGSAAIRKVTLSTGVDSVFAQGVTIIAPTLLADRGAGRVVYVDGLSLAQAGASPHTIHALAEAPTALALDLVADRAVLVSATNLTFQPLDGTAPTTTPLDAAVGAGRAVAVDSFGNVYVGGTDELVELLADGTTRALAYAGDPLMPFAGCIGALAVQADDVLVADRCTGAVARIAVE